MPNLPLCDWSSQLFDLRAPSLTDVPVLLLNQPVDVNVPGFVSITETWLGLVVPGSAVHLSNYILFRRDRPTMREETAFLSMQKFHVPVSVPLSHLKLNRYGLKLDHCVFQDGCLQLG